MQHIIKKQSIQLAIPKELDAFRMQQLAGTHYWRDVLPVLEELFEELFDEAEVVRIDELEIDLGIIAEKEMMQENWSAEILMKIKNQFREKIAAKKGEQKDYIQQKKPLNSCQQWLFYMEKGILPWNTWQVTESWYKDVLEALATDFRSAEALKKLIEEKPLVVRRIVQQHKKDFLTALIEIITTHRQQHLEKAISELVEVFSVTGSTAVTSSVSGAMHAEMWEEILKLSVTERALTEVGLIEKMLITHLPDALAIKPIIAVHSSRLPVILPVLQKLEEKSGLWPEKKVLITKQKNETQNDQPSATSETVGEEGFYVQHAGLVLVHAFLHPLFKRLLWVKEGRFENSIAQQKAVYLLHYLATGNTEAAEFELVAPKLLCSWPMEMPVEKNIELTNEELSEADNMLRAAVEQWTALKNTSNDGLREGFLQRNGKLFRKNDTLSLQLESSAIDVLLDQLPWNLSMIKLPWMKEILRVEWR